MVSAHIDSNQETPIHLVVSVFVTDNGLNRYKLGKARSANDSRLDVFLTALDSHRAQRWESVRIYYQLDGRYRQLSNSVRDLLVDWFPNAHVEDTRLEYFRDWKDVAENFASPKELVLLNTNDDHAFIAGRETSFRTLAGQLAQTPGNAGLASVTHFAESWGNSGTPWMVDPFEGSNVRAVLRTNIEGTCLVKASMFRSWWMKDFTGGSRIVRPDNPFGPSISFDPTLCLIPPRELMRHMDGYSHVSLSRPLAPLRSVLSTGEGLVWPPSVGKAWTAQSWPTRLQAWSGNDYADTERVSVPSATRTTDLSGDVSAIRAAFAHRISLSSLKLLVPDRGRHAQAYRFGAVSLALITPTVVKRWPRFFLDWSVGRTLFALSPSFPRARVALDEATALGWRHTMKLAIKSVVGAESKT